MCWPQPGQSGYSGINNKNYYSYITSPGFQGIPSYEDFISKDEIYLNTKCSTDKKQLKMYTNEIMGLSYFHTYIDNNTPIFNSYRELPCYSKIINCALCGGVDPSKCKMCMDGFTLVNVTDSQNTTAPQCLQDICGYGKMVVKNWNGISYCKPCGITNCNDCGMVKVPDQSGSKT